MGLVAVDFGRVVLDLSVLGSDLSDRDHQHCSAGTGHNVAPATAPAGTATVNDLRATGENRREDLVGVVAKTTGTVEVNEEVQHTTAGLSR